MKDCDNMENGNSDIEDMLDPKKGAINWTLKSLKGIIHSDKKIGEMNGRWAALFRIVLVLSFICIPTFVGWTAWVTRSIWSTKHHIESTIRFEERIDILEKNGIILERLDKRTEDIMNDLKSRPNPQQVKEQVEHNSAALVGLSKDVVVLDQKNTAEHNQISQEINSQIANLERDNATDHAKISTSLEFIKEQVSK